MKRIFPVIIVLITLSLLGIIVLQVSWFRDMIALRQSQLSQKAEEAGFDVSNDLSNTASSAPYVKIPRKQNLSLLPNDFAIGFGRPLLSQHFSTFEIKEKLKKAFDEKGLKDVSFEFAITSNATSYNLEMQSENFIKEVDDTVHNKRVFIAIVPPESSSLLEPREPFENLILVIPDLKSQVWGSMVWMIVGAVVFTLIIVTAFGVTVQALLRQKKLSEIKTDFINNMTHEFKTPLATISLAVDALRNEKVMSKPEKMDYFSGIIKEENKRMNKHVETILQAALLDKQELKLDMKKVHLHTLVQSALNNYRLQIEDKQGKVFQQLDATNDEIIADEAHFTNMISNLLDNAIKYSKENLVIKVSTCNQGKKVQIKIQDNGIGMNKETTKRVFEKFYRAHTGNIHNVKGFGLGMSYVKTVIDVHKGHIKVESVLGKGTCFTVEVPVAEKND
ncbi:MAG TPA: HAMP domain-containing sensor histidine kinase [Segetibacter sp.]|jgi:two-component system phosphate regulon sensor histidine kinase PhoR